MSTSTCDQSGASPATTHERFNLPLPVWMVLLTLAIALFGGMDAPGVINAFNAGFGRALGEFALILIPSFTLAACVARQPLSSAGSIASAAAPFTGAGMVCPDTAYAALSPIAGRHKLSVAFGSYAGFKLLFPAGPLVVATGLGVDSPSLLLVGLVLLGPVWLIGEAWVRYRDRAEREGAPARSRLGLPLVRLLLPFLVLAALLVAGSVLGATGSAVLNFLTSPKGALLVAAAWALVDTDPTLRRECLDSAMRRTGMLLLVIGAASAFGSVLIGVLPLTELLPKRLDAHTAMLSLFLIAMAFKLAQGSSMATFAVVTPVVAPLVAGLALDPMAAVFAICLGSFIGILPNDSFFWLVRRDVLAGRGDREAMLTLTGGAALQAFAGLATLYLLVEIGFVA